SDACFTARRREQSSEHADSGRLTRAVRAEEPEHLTGAHVEGDAVDGGECAKSPREVLGLDGERVAHLRERSDGASAGTSLPSGAICAMNASSMVTADGCTSARAMPRSARKRAISRPICCWSAPGRRSV